MPQIVVYIIALEGESSSINRNYPIGYFQVTGIRDINISMMVPS